jgi:hypothetical protein
MDEKRNSELSGMLSKDSLDADWRLCDGYISFSSELLRVSLLALTAIGALLFRILDRNNGAVTSHAKCAMIPAVICLLACSTFALLHRYTANDAMAEHIDLLRKRGSPKVSEEKLQRIESARNRRLGQSGKLLFAAQIALIFGVIASMVALLRLL